MVKGGHLSVCSIWPAGHRRRSGCVSFFVAFHLQIILLYFPTVLLLIGNQPEIVYFTHSYSFDSLFYSFHICHCLLSSPSLCPFFCPASRTYWHFNCFQCTCFNYLWGFSFIGNFDFSQPRQTNMTHNTNFSQRKLTFQIRQLTFELLPCLSYLLTLQLYNMHFS